MMTPEQFAQAFAEIHELPQTCQYKVLYVDACGRSLTDTYADPSDAWRAHERYVLEGYAFVSSPFPAPRGAR